MNYNEALEFLLKNLPNYQKVGDSAIRPGLHNIKLLCNKFNNPQNKFKSIHIGGTNGKGTTSATIANLCENINLKVGLFSSPHVFDYRERIQVNGKKIKKKFIKKFISKNFKFFNEIKPSFFETSTIMAFEYFKRKNVDIAIIEVGLGGRLDSTNIIDPLVGLVTNVGYDHQNILGKKLSEIAYEKSGIIKNGMTFIKGETQNNIDNIFEDECIKNNTKLIYSSDEIQIKTISKSLKKRKINVFYKEDTYKINLSNPTEYYLKNIYSSLVVFFYIKKHFNVKTNNKLKLNNKFKVLGRWNVISKNPTIISDGCHNYDGFKAVVKEINSFDFKTIYFIIGGVKEKDWEKIISTLPKNYNYIVTEPSVERAKDKNELCKMLKKNKFNCKVYRNINESIEHCRKIAQSDDLIFIGGSLFLISELNEK